jgi:ABC-2 type transport system permease protein
MRFLKFSFRFFFNEIREFEVLFWSIVFPLVLYFFLSAILGRHIDDSESGAFSLGVVREEVLQVKTPVDQALEQLSVKVKLFDLVPFDSREKAERELKNNKVDIVLVIPKGTAQAAARAFTPSGTGIPLEVLKIGGRESSKVAANVLAAAFDRANLEIGKAMDPRYISVTGETKPVGGTRRKVDYEDYIFPSIALMMMLSVGLFNSPLSLIFCRTTGINRKLYSTPLRSGEYFGAHMVKLVLTMLVALMLLYVMAYFVYHVRDGIFSLAFLGSMLLGMVVLVSFGLMLASFATKESTAIALGQTFNQVMMFLGGFYFPVFGLPWGLRWLVYALPTSWLVELGRRSMGIATTDQPLGLLIGVPCAWLVVSLVVFSLNFRKVMGYE